MVEYLGFTPEELFTEVADRAREEGVTNQEAWNDIVEEVIDEKNEFGEMHPDEDIGVLKEMFRGRWGEYQKTI